MHDNITLLLSSWNGYNKDIELTIILVLIALDIEDDMLPSLKINIQRIQ